MNRLEHLFRPRSIAVVGGGTWCATVIGQCRRVGFAGEIWPVHPTREAVADLPAYPTIEDLPGVPDAAFVGVNRDATIDVVAALSARGAKGAVCFASGFGEAQAERGDGADKQAALLEAAGDMRLVGPNCYGVLNYLDGAALWPDQQGGERVDRGVAIITQSSNIAMNLTMQTRGLPLGYVVAAGNQAQTGVAEIATALLHDERVTALGLHIEGFGDLRTCEAMVAEARRLGKPIVALKSGRTEQARAAAVSHTASLAGSDAGARALMDRLGIAEVSTLPAMLETLKLLHVTGPLPSSRVASLSCSGGEAGLIADAGHAAGLNFPPLGDRQKRDLRAALGPSVALANPLDYHTFIWGKEEGLTQVFEAMASPELALTCVVLDHPRDDRCNSTEWDCVLGAVERCRADTGQPMAVVSTLGETMPEPLSRWLIARGIVPLAGLAEATEAIAHAARLGSNRRVAAPVLVPKAATSERVLSEAEAKAALAAHGMRVPQARRVSSPQEAGAIAVEIGFPVVLKGEGIAHKTEAGAVVLNLSSPEAVETAARRMPCESFLVEEMITGVVAELLVGVVRDPAHGYVLTLAAGGTLTELLKDSASLLVPAARDDVAEALARLKVTRLLTGYRGAPSADISAILDAVMALQHYVAAAHPGEVEINPLLCGPAGAVAADALIRIGDDNE